ncbi:MAG: hypothetical protein V4489_05660 [Chlamydiota bacterium]
MNEQDADAVTYALFSPIGEVLARQKADALSAAHQLPASKEEQYIKEQTEVLTQDIQKQYATFAQCMKKSGSLLERNLRHLPPLEKEHHEY